MTTSSIPQKRCSNCSNEYPATTEYFKPDKESPSGIHSWCRVCHRAAAKRRYQEHRTEINAKTSARYHLNPEPHRLYHRAHYQKPEVKARCAEQAREWAKKHPEKMREYAKRSRSKRKVKRNEYLRAWRSANPEKTREHSRRHKSSALQSRVYTSRRRAHKLASLGRHTKSDVVLQYQSQKGLCWWCGKPLDPKKYHVDHRVPLSKGGSDDARNICITCPRCNLSKHDKMPHEWNGRLL